MNCRRVFSALFLFTALWMSLPTDAHALFQLTVSPRRGGQNIRFESADAGGLLRNEEVTLAVETDRNVQYQIYQTLYQPLSNEFGNSIPTGAFIEFAASGSSVLGKLRTELESPVTMGQKQIYVSNSAGDSDEFLLVFNVRVPQDQPGGVYHSQLTFTAEPLTGQAGVSPSIVTMDVRVEISPKFRISIENIKGGKELDLGRINQEHKQTTGILNLQIDSNIGTRYRLFQQLTDPPVSSLGNALNDEALTFTATGGAEGVLSGQGTSQPLPQSSELLYQSNEHGAGDKIQLQFTLNPAATQKAGIYMGNLSFRVDSASPSVQGEVINIPVKLEVEQIFGLDTRFESGSGLGFGVLRGGGEDKQERKVFLTVRSNLGEPYQITQVASRQMTNEEGSVIPAEHFQFYAQNGKTGTVSAASPTPVKEGETVVFTSDKNGTPEDIVLNYSLVVPKESKAGSYHTELRYSITTL